MNTYDAYAPRGLYRNADRAVLGGVCAGFADYFGFNLRVTRILALIAFVVAMPMAIIVYMAIVFLVPARSTGDVRQYVSRRERRCARKEAQRKERERARAAPSIAASEVRRRAESLDKRLARLEKYITSSRYQLDSEFRKL